MYMYSEIIEYDILTILLQKLRPIAIVHAMIVP